MPVGQLGTIRYALAAPPTTTVSFIQVDFSVSAGAPGGWSLGLTGMVAAAMSLDRAVEVEVPRSSLGAGPLSLLLSLPLSAPHPPSSQGCQLYAYTIARLLASSHGLTHHSALWCTEPQVGRVWPGGISV